MTSSLETWADLPVLINPCAANARACVLLAHGAGAPMDSGFMEAMAAELAKSEFTVVRFEFPYMQARRTQQKKLPPNRMPRLLEHWQQLLAVAAQRTDLPLLVAGKSMGGRAASMVMADEEGLFRPWQARLLAGICFGYPFHPPAKPDKTRIAHLQPLARPLCIFQGTRDAFGKPAEVAEYGLSEAVSLHWLESGDHDFKPLKRSGKTQQDLIANAAEKTRHFVSALL